MKVCVGAIAVAVGLAACATRTAEEVRHREALDHVVERVANELVLSHYRADRPGVAVLVARGDTVLFRGARGEADINTHARLQADSVFRIGSVTKQFTAAALLTLAEDGRVRLDDPLSRYFPNYPNGEHITLLQLLNHTAGIREYTGLPGYQDGVREDITTAQIIDLFSREPADFAPGENWAYSNSGYVLIGAVIETVTRMPWHAYLEQKFFEPLGMRHTGYAAEPRFAAQQVRGYTYDGETVASISPMSMTQPHAAGALVSNVDDLFTWNRALHEGRVLRSEAYARMITPEGAAARDGIGYGFGFYTDSVRGYRVLRHGGRISGFIASLNYLPGPDITVVVLENDDEHNGVEEADALARRLLAVALGEPYPEAREVSADEAALHAMEGVFGFDGGTRRTLRVVDGRLTAQRDVGPRIPLTPIGVDDFLYADGFNRLRIERDGSGAVAAVRFFAKGDGPGERGTRVGGSESASPAGLLLSHAALERLVGVYANNQATMTISLQGETLWAQIEGQSPFRLLARSTTRFDVLEAGASLEFSSAAERAADLVVRQNGREMTLRRSP